MEYLDAPTVKEHLRKTATPSESNGGTSQEDVVNMKSLARKMGVVIGQLHNLGVVHGDLTTSNMILFPKEDDDEHDELLALIDFGLSKSTSSVEEQAVDLYVLERALYSTHPHLPETFFEIVLEAYASTTANKSEKKSQQTTLQRLEQVRLRGRKRECFG
jgi:TP53 regulating kinase-like protein